MLYLYIQVPQTGTDRISKCMELDANNNSNMTVTVFANERVFTYPIQLYEILKIDTTDITSGSNANTTVFVMYSMPTTGTSKNSTAINLVGTEQCTTVFTFHPTYKNKLMRKCSPYTCLA